VQQHDVDVTVRAQLTAAVTADGDERHSAQGVAVDGRVHELREPGVHEHCVGATPRSSGQRPVCQQRSPVDLHDKKLQSLTIALAGAHPDHAFDGRHPYLAVADLPGAGHAGDGVDDSVDIALFDQDLDAGLRHEVDLVLRAPVDLGVARLPAKALDLGDGHTVYVGALERLFHVVELERLHDGGDQLHDGLSTAPRPPVS